LYRKAYFSNRFFNTFVLIAGIFYALIMIKLLFIRGAGHFSSTYDYNLFPLKTITQYITNREHYNQDTWIKNLFGNIILFIPLGVVFPILNKRLLKLGSFILWMLILLICVELVQMLTKVGSLDIDDVILNMVGALIGILFTKLLLTIFFTK
jgi:glycopeptide antibiotics resistance protein